MGRAAKQRKRSRMKTLAELAKNHPQIFEREWNKRLNSWMVLIAGNAGKLSNRNGRRMTPLFDIVGEALACLRFCGEDAYRKYADRTYDLLTTECCRQFAKKTDPCLYRPTYFPEPKPEQQTIN